MLADLRAYLGHAWAGSSGENDRSARTYRASRGVRREHRGCYSAVQSARRNTSVPFKPLVEYMRRHPARDRFIPFMSLQVIRLPPVNAGERSLGRGVDRGACRRKFRLSRVKELALPRWDVTPICEGSIAEIAGAIESLDEDRA